MFNQLKLVAIVAVVGFVGYSLLFGSKSEQAADLGAVLDRTEFALMNYEKHLSENGVVEVADENVAEFTTFLTLVMNSDPRFYDETLGVEIQKDARILGFVDPNADGVQDEGEAELFTVEIDEANNRLIASDASGNSSGLRFSGAGFLAGAFIGSMLSRQRGAGIAANSFNNRNVTPRSSYKAPSSARSGGLRAGK